MTLNSIIILSCLIAILLITPSAVLAKDPNSILEGIVTKKSYRDTINVNDPLGNKFKIRLCGLDAPETEKSNKKTVRISKPRQPYGAEAWNAMYALTAREMHCC